MTAEFPRPPSFSLPELYAALHPVTAPATQSVFENWGRTFRCEPLAIFDPTSERHLELIVELAQREKRTVRAVGVGHSPSDLACTSDFLVRMGHMDKIIEVNAEKQYVIAQGGIILQRLHAALDAHGLAMINLGSISEQTLAGMVTTATHGTGYDHPVLSTHVLAIRLLLPDGSRITCSRTENVDIFMATLCGLGATGIILDIKMQVTEKFRLREVQETQPFDEVVNNLDSIFRSSEFVRLWWWPQDRKIRVSAMDKSIEPKRPLHSWLWHSFVGYHVVQLLLFIGLLLPSFNISVGRFTSWLVRNRTVAVDDSLNVFNIDCKYRHHTTEWALPYDHAQACLRDLRDWLEKEFADPNGLRPHCPLELRVSAADEVWLSPSYGQRTCWIGIMQYKPYGYNVPYRTLFRSFEDILIRHGGRPHWAKAHHLRPDDLRALYPRFDDFRAVLARVDPQGMLRNEYVGRHIFGAEGPRFSERVFKTRL
ncbi:L-gulonolactone/D-arabinono-1,4-lactone oxidase [Vararia minispora EC-137]|uniref:L-gulonolactone/D-arabinono-1,4-lactone oxidase n=1 Tax=Vararia minispora EC-137 TaxID=1314806 RepID=A0ACB8QMG0_9AGAM|nr:L-gulonolactone/D-arabinono-1,4-lactone oxidase [Vararia minispora EC-137]